MPRGRKKAVEIIENNAPIEELMVMEPAKDEEISVVLNTALEDSVFNEKKAEKTMMLRTIEELKEFHRQMKEAYQSLCHEFDVKNKALSHLNNEIKYQHFVNERQKTQMAKDNAEQIRQFEEQRSKVQKAAETYEKLTSEVIEKKRQLEIELTKIADERRQSILEAERLNLHVKQIEGECKRRESDTKDLLDKLEKDRKEFEDYKNSLEPELNKINEIKSENLRLLQRIEQERRDFDATINAYEAHKLQHEEDHKKRMDQLNQIEANYKADEGRLRKWERDLEDQALEVRAQSTEAQKALKRAQLQKQIASGKGE